MRIKGKRDLTLCEELLLDSIKLPGVCPKCGRAVLFTSKDLYWVFGSTIKHADGTVTENKGGWHAECKCGQPIRVNIIAEIER